jgi:HEAT repeat protein
MRRGYFPGLARLGAAQTHIRTLTRGVSADTPGPTSAERQQAREMLTRKGPSVIPKLLDAWGGYGSGDISEILVALGEPATNAVIDLLHHADGSKRAQAAYFLGWQQVKRAVPHLLETLHDPNPKTRRAAASALGNIGDRQALEPLITTMQDSDSGVRERTAEALGLLGDQRALAALVVALDDEEFRIRAAAAQALGQIGDLKAVEPLIAALEHNQVPKTKDVLLNIIRSLGQLGDTRAVQPIRDTLDEHKLPNRSVREYIRETVDEVLGKLVM